MTRPKNYWPKSNTWKDNSLLLSNIEIEHVTPETFFLSLSLSFNRENMEEKLLTNFLLLSLSFLFCLFFTTTKQVKNPLPLSIPSLNFPQNQSHPKRKVMLFCTKMFLIVYPWYDWWGLYGKERHYSTLYYPMGNSRLIPVLCAFHIIFHLRVVQVLEVKKLESNQRILLWNLNLNIE